MPMSVQLTLHPFQLERRERSNKAIERTTVKEFAEGIAGKIVVNRQTNTDALANGSGICLYFVSVQEVNSVVKTVMASHLKFILWF